MLRCALVVSLAALLLSSAAGATRIPLLRSVGQGRGHVLVAFSPGELEPVEVVVSTSPHTEASGALAAPWVRLRETMVFRSRPANGIFRWRTTRALPAGVYYVQVSGSDLAGVVDCMPVRMRCGEEWSNVLRLVIPREA